MCLLRFSHVSMEQETEKALIGTALNAAAASAVENYEEGDKIVPRYGTDGENYQTDYYA
jgi:hypothetical protein